MRVLSTVARRALAVWLIDHGFAELGGKATSHRAFATNPASSLRFHVTAKTEPQPEAQRHDVRQLEATGCDRDKVRRDLSA
jgi:hypothetical protein